MSISHNKSYNISSAHNEAQPGQLDASKLTLREIFEFKLIYHSMPVCMIILVAYTIVFVVGLVVNLYVFVIIRKSPRERRVTTDYFMVNLAFADILVLVFCLPVSLTYSVIVTDILGLYTCKIITYIQGIVVSTSIYILVATTADRCLTILYPLNWNPSKNQVRWFIGVIWLFGLLVRIPWPLYFELVPDEFTSNNQVWLTSICRDEFPSKRYGRLYFIFANLTLLYLAPGVLASLFYLRVYYKIKRLPILGDGLNAQKQIESRNHKAKLKVIRMMSVVVFVFMLSWLPLYLLVAFKKFGPEELSDVEKRFTRTMKPIAEWLGLSNSCINPMLYALFDARFKEAFGRMLKFCSCFRGNNHSDNNPSEIQLQLLKQKPQCQSNKGLLQESADVGTLLQL